MEKTAAVIRENLFFILIEFLKSFTLQINIKKIGNIPNPLCLFYLQPFEINQ